MTPYLSVQPLSYWDQTFHIHGMNRHADKLEMLIRPYLQHRYWIHSIQYLSTCIMWTYKHIGIVTVHQWWQKANISWATAGCCSVEDTSSPCISHYMLATVDKTNSLWGVTVWYCCKHYIITFLIVIFFIYISNFKTLNIV